MRSSRNRFQLPWFNRVNNKKLDTTDTQTDHSDVALSSDPATRKVGSPVFNFYKNKLEKHLQVFYRFALQSRSVSIRDIFAQVGSNGRHSLVDLLSVLENRTTAVDRRAKDWTGYNNQVLLGLADLLANTAKNDLDTHSALLLYDFVLDVWGQESFADTNRLQYVEALAQAGRYSDMSEYNESLGIEQISPLQVELLQLQKVRHECLTDVDWLSAVNRFYERQGMSYVRLLDDTSLPLLDRLASDSAKVVDGPKVSVIMPTFSPGRGIYAAIRSLLEQTWKNLEIIIVDDASPDEYASLFNELSQLDPRVTVIRQTHNAGAYVARNTGLAHATGDFITTHDDDDWSHPDKIATQAGAMLDDNQLVATTSSHIRTTEALDFQRMNMHAKFIQMNYSSLMFRKTIVDEIGTWDTVNRGGDSEFLTRIIENYGSDRFLRLLDKPLSFSRVWSGSLTSGEMSRGYFANSRLLYRWAFRQWHWNSNKQGTKAILRSGAAREYPVPTTFEPGARNSDLGIFDVIYVTDYFRQAKFVNTVLQEIKTLVSRGFRIGYMHLYSPQTNRAAGIPQELFDLQLAGKVTQVSHDDEAQTELLLVYDSAIGMFLDGYRSTVKCRRAVVIDQKSATLSGSEDRTPTLLSQSLRNLDSCFETQFKIVGTTIEDQRRLDKQVPALRRLSDEMTWYMHVSEEAEDIRLPSAEPVVGFHSYGNQYRWPANENVFKSVYLSEEYDTFLFGHLTPARNKYNESVLERVNLIHFSEMEERSFLQKLDFWVYFPHHRLNDSIWGPVLSAMHAGKIVILPNRLEKIYGDAALYGDPEEVSSLVSYFSQDTSAYIKQVNIARKFISELFSTERLQWRIEQLIYNNR